MAVALGNWGSEEAVPLLVEALTDSEPLVRGHAAWALGEIASSSAYAALADRLVDEGDPWVREELELALARPIARPSAPPTRTTVQRTAALACSTVAHGAAKAITPEADLGRLLRV